MTAIEKKQRLIQRIQEIPDQLVDEANHALDTILEKERQRKDHFEQLLAETSERYKEVFKALA